MDSKAIDDAMKRQLPVMYDGQRYDRILEYISWYDGNKKRNLSVGLLRGNHYCRVQADKVTLAE